ncbi:adenylate kinase [Acrasis kona]|uniref:Adenylate kinase isoenzyme 6 homolog n=1 Tax=Acrasis kona TaxID=1008807 RepID=A0AAW2Z193_9EUKA
MQQTSKRLRKFPNILVTGTPGCGKTTLCENIVSAMAQQNIKYNHLNVSQIAVDGKFTEEYDMERQTHVLDEEPLLDHLEEILSDFEETGYVVDYHSSELFPERWFDAVVCLATDNTVLYNRLSKRGYAEQKIQENLQCEIFQVCLQEAQESYDKDLVLHLVNDTDDDMEDNVESISKLINTGINSRRNL